MASFLTKPKDKVRALSYYRTLSRQYDAAVGRGGNGILGLFRNRERSAIIGLAQFQPGERLIDVGCGNGYYARQAKSSGMHVTVTDAVAEMLEVLSSDMDHAFVCDLEELRVESVFDCVICVGVLDFVLDPGLAFANLCRLVGPGGRLVLLVPKAGIFGWIYRIEKWLIGVNVNLFTRAWLLERAKQEGLGFVGAKEPLPTNLVLRFDRPTMETPPLRTSISPGQAD